MVGGGDRTKVTEKDCPSPREVSRKKLRDSVVYARPGCPHENACGSTMDNSLWPQVQILLLCGWLTFDLYQPESWDVKFPLKIYLIRKVNQFKNSNRNVYWVLTMGSYHSKNYIQSRLTLTTVTYVLLLSAFYRQKLGTQSGWANYSGPHS